MSTNLANLNPRYTGSTLTGLGSGSIWNDLPANISEPGKGFHVFLDNTDIPKHASTGSAVTANLGPVNAYLDAGGFIRTPTTAVVDPGVEVGSDGDNELVTIIHGGAKGIMAGSSPTLWFEAEIKSSTIAATKHGWFVGLVEHAALAATNVLLDDSDALADKNLIGFNKLVTGGTVDIVYKADGQTAQTLLATATTLVADTYVRLGFKLIPKNPITKRVVFYVNGVAVSTYLTTTNMAAATFPSDVNLGVALTVNNATGSTPGYATFKWARLAQVAS